MVAFIPILLDLKAPSSCDYDSIRRNTELATALLATYLSSEDIQPQHRITVVPVDRQAFAHHDKT